jgi:glutamate 5-kinase
VRIWKTEKRFLNARDTLRALLDNNIVPVINENDAVATAEIKVGDNDNLCAGRDSGRCR